MKTVILFAAGLIMSGLIIAVWFYPSFSRDMGWDRCGQMTREHVRLYSDGKEDEAHSVLYKAKALCSR